MTLPSSDQVDVSVLARLFADTTNSYKYLYFLAILDALDQRYTTAGSATLSLRELALGMLAHAWYPYKYFRLSFGTQDQIGRLLDQLPLVEGLSFDRNGREKLREELSRSCNDRQLKEILRYVPQRLLRGFFVQELRGEHQVDRRLVELVAERFEERRPLYRFEDPWHIRLHPNWVAYLSRNCSIIRGWACWEWLGYMQDRNPNVPAVGNKLFPPLERAALTEQTKFWRLAASSTELHCIYTDRAIVGRNFSLDHFIPWSFVAHDRLWNLIPTLPSANSSKSDWIPHPDYLGKLAEIQALGLLAARPHFQRERWTKLVDAHVADLHLPADLLNRETIDRATLRTELEGAYQRTIVPLMELATQMGFPAGWRAGMVHEGL